MPPISVVADEIPVLSVTLTGGGVPASAPRGFCPQAQQTYSDQPFTGQGNFTAPPGLVEQEIAAATYLVPATDWPILIDVAEIIWVQNHFNTTVSEWSYLVWEGTPDTGTLVAEFSSNGVDLPHVQLPIGGSQAVSLQVVVDPGDPEQIIVQNNGTNRFSIGFRIDGHNNPPSAPCTEPCLGFGSLPAICCPPNQSTNAWPAMDAAGPGGAASMQWLFARDCPGATGLCASVVNSGWHQLSDTGTLPPNFVNDWAMRVLYTPLQCVIPEGACCLTTGACSEEQETVCNSLAGIFQGANTLCSAVQCPQPQGACCLLPSGCFTTSNANCGVADGFWQGAGTTCATTVCFPMGACCLPDGTCQDDTSDTDCALLNGTFIGDETTCASVECPQPFGACCLSNGNCLDLVEADCTQIPGADWAGFGSDCIDGNTNGMADDCEAGNPCDGVLLGDYDGSTIVNGADIQGFVAAMLSANPTQADVCAGDFNGSSGLDVGDIGGMVSALLN